MSRQDQLDYARTLPTPELQRHSLVSINNRHYCRECFCCACIDVLEERQRELRIEERQ